MKEKKQSEKPPVIPEERKSVKKGLSRRGFLKGAGMTTAGTVILQTGILEQTRAGVKEDNPLGPGAVLIKLKVNGHNHMVQVEPRATLAQVLRDHLELTGTKVVCDRGSCSACAVWLDGKPVNSCMTLAMDVGNSEITTIEGIHYEGELHPVQQAFIDHDATQCGYCTPGMIMTTIPFLNENKNPSLEDVKVALRGNLCRCGTQPHIFKAVLDASKKM
jgi:aerobic-type carbon monoxide dehydrogenase small subunit (CoxS/CutS family)